MERRRQMKDFFNAIRLPLKKVPLFKTAVHTAALFFCGLLTGIAIKLLDLHNPYLGDIFSQLSVWIFLGTVIAVYGSSPKRASVNVFFFCVGMLITYYLTAEFTSSVYSWTFIYGWTFFSCCSPVFAFLTWYAKGKGWFAKLIAVGIVICMLAAAVLLFDKIRAADLFLSIAALIILLKK